MGHEPKEYPYISDSNSCVKSLSNIVETSKIQTLIQEEGRRQQVTPLEDP